MRVAVCAALVSLMSAVMAPASAQWLDYPTPGIPRLPDGKPDLERSRAPNGRWQAGFVGHLVPRGTAVRARGL